MPDLQDFLITAKGSAAGTSPQFEITGRVTDSRTGATLADFTQTPIRFPQDLTGYTAAQRRELVELIARKLIEFRTGM